MSRIRLLLWASDAAFQLAGVLGLCAFAGLMFAGRGDKLQNWPATFGAQCAGASAMLAAFGLASGLFARRLYARRGPDPWAN